MLTAPRARYTRDGLSPHLSFAGASAASCAEEAPSRKAFFRGVEDVTLAAASAPAAVGEAPPLSSVSSSCRSVVSFSHRTALDASPAATSRIPITPTFFPSAAMEPVTVSSTTAAATTTPLDHHQRHHEMSQLIDQMCSVDVGRLADRVAMLSTSAPSQLSQTSPLQWRQSHNLSAPGADDECEDGRHNCNNIEQAELLRHIAVFLRFFSQCAKRFLLLAREEERRMGDAASTTPNATSLSPPPPHLEERGSPVDVPSQPPPPGGRHRIIGGKSNTEQRPCSTTGLLHDKGNHGPDHRFGVNSGGGADERVTRGTGNTATCSQNAGTEHRVAMGPTSEPFAEPSSIQASTAASVHHHDVEHVDAAASSSRRVPSCESGIRQAPLSSSAPPRSSPASLSTTTVKRSNSPTHRTKTLSPFTSSRSRCSGFSLRTPSPLLRRGGEATQDATSAAETARTRGGQRSPSTLLGGSPLATSPRPPTSPPMRGGALVLPPPPSLPFAPRRVHVWTPSSQLNRYTAACAALQSGDCVVLQPGVYYEELMLDNCGHVELTSAFPGAAVVLRPSSPVAPALCIRGARSQVDLKGVVLVQGGGGEVEEGAEAKRCLKVGAATSVDPSSSSSAAPALPLLSVSGGATLQATACHFYGGAGGGIVVAGLHTRVRLDLCLISRCGFAGLYVRNGASIEAHRSRVRRNEAGLRVLNSFFYVYESTVEENKGDGVVVHEGSMGVLEGSSLINNGGNGLFLEGGVVKGVQVIASTIELNALYGVQSLRGSKLRIRSSYIRDNGLLPIREEND